MFLAPHSVISPGMLPSLRRSAMASGELDGHGIEQAAYAIVAYE